MRNPNRRDWLALAAPGFVLLIVGVVVTRERGWLAGLLTAGLGVIFVGWVWLRQMRKHPDNTWRARL